MPNTKTSTHLVLTYSQPKVNLGSDARNTAATETPREKTRAPTRKFICVAKTIPTKVITNGIKVGHCRRINFCQRPVCLGFSFVETARKPLDSEFD